MTAPSRNRWMLLLAAAASLLLAPRPAPAADNVAKLAPEDSMLLVAVPDVSALIEKFKATETYALYKNPAMQPFIGPAEKAITELIEKGMAEGFSEMGIQRPKELPWPKTHAVFILRMGTETVERPDYRNWRGGDERPKMIQVKQPAPHIVLLLGMGENAESAKDLVKKITDSMVEKEKARRQHETIRGAEVDVLTEPPVKVEGDDRPVRANREPVCIGFKDKTFLVGNNLELIKDVVTRMGGEGQSSLADAPGLKAVRTAFGEPNPAAVLAYLNVKALIAMAKAATEDTDEREKMIKTISVLGFENITGVGMSLELAPTRQIDGRVKVQVAIRGERTGIPALAVPPAMPTKPGPMVTRGLPFFLMANYDVAKLVDQIIRVADAATGENTEKEMERGMEETRGEGNDGEPPVDLKKEVFGQLGGPLTFLMQATKPYTAADSAQALLAVGIRDAKVLDKALGRIHDKLIVQGDKDARRELLNTRIYLMPDLMTAFMSGVTGRSGGAIGQKGFGLAVVGEQVVFGSIKYVEQAIRDRGGDGKANVESITADPMYQHAAKFLPAQASAFFYLDARAQNERSWAMLKELAKMRRQNPPDAEFPMPLPPTRDKFQAPAPAQDGPPDFPRPPTRRVRPSGPFADIPGVGQLLGSIDFSALPEFAAVRKHFGASVGYLVANDQGIYLELVGVKPPAGE